jgi:uncharacterized protein (DUF58 family)
MTPALADIPRLSRSRQLELAARRVVEGLYAGRHRSPYTGPATEFADHRPYMAGDDLRSVDWKAYARSDHLLIRRYREERDLPLALIVDTSASMDYGTPAKHDWAGTAAAALGLLACDQGDRVRLVAGAAGLDAVSPELGGAAGAAKLVAHLAELSAQGASDLPGLCTALGRRIERRTLVVLLSDGLTDATAWARPLGALTARGHDVAVIQILDRSEVALPETWRLSRFEDPEGQVPTMTCDAAAVKRTYDAAMAAHIDACRAMLAGCRADHVLAITDQDVSDVLGVWLQQRKRR